MRRVRQGPLEVPAGRFERRIHADCSLKSLHGLLHFSTIGVDTAEIIQCRSRWVANHSGFHGFDRGGQITHSCLHYTLLKERL